jgi:hypothetical protein
MVDISKPGDKQSQYNKFINVRRDAVDKKKLHINLNTYSKKYLSFQSSSFDEEERQFTKGPGFPIPTKLFGELDVALDIVKGWLKLKEYDYLFNKNGDGNIVGLGGPPPFKPGIFRDDNRFLRFAPAIVKNEQTGVVSEGVSISTNSGPIVRMDCANFLTLYTQLKSYLSNCYGDTLQLVNLATNLATFEKLNM